MLFFCDHAHSCTILLQLSTVLVCALLSVKHLQLYIEQGWTAVETVCGCIGTGYLMCSSLGYIGQMCECHTVYG